MKHLRLSFISLLLVLALFFNIERLDLGAEDLINIPSFIYVYVLGVVMALLFIPALWSLSLPAVVAIGFVVFALLRLFVFTGQPLFGGLYSYVTITELAFLGLSILLTYRVARQLYDFEEAVANITFSDTYRRVPRLEDAQEQIQIELTRSRRYHSPLSVIIVGAKTETVQVRLHRTVQEVQRAMMTRYVYVSMARVISTVLRRTDLVIDQREKGRFIVLSPETNSEESEVVMERIQQAVGEQLGIEVTCSIATFPEDALTFEELLDRAAKRQGSQGEEEPLLPHNVDA